MILLNIYPTERKLCVLLSIIFSIKIFFIFFLSSSHFKDLSRHAIFLESCSFCPIPLKLPALSIRMGYAEKDRVFLQTGMIQHEFGTNLSCLEISNNTPISRG